MPLTSLNQINKKIKHWLEFKTKENQISFFEND